MRVLITGITGFVGSHLAEACLEAGHEVAGTYRWRSRMDNLVGCVDRIALYECDLRDGHSIRKVIREFAPERVYHLAAQSFVQASWSSPAETITTNVTSQVHLFEAVREADIATRILIAGSSEEYGLVHPDELPIRESNPLRPLSPYAVSKIGQDMLAYQYHQSYGLWVVRTRAFNHEGPRRGEVFVTSSFAKQIAEAEAGQRPAIINVGNLEAQRDYTDARDVVRAYQLALERCVPGEVYNIGSGEAWSIQRVLDTLLSLSALTFEVRSDPARMRPSDVPILVADSSRFREATGWEPRIPFDTTLRDTLEYWRARVKGVI